MNCEGCGNISAKSLKVFADHGLIREICDKCGVSSIKGPPDVYFREPYFDSNLGNEQHPYGQWITSKSHKAMIMRNQKIRERGDRIHGARTAYDPKALERSQKHTSLNLEGEN